MGAGILPVTIIKGTIFFLLGKERCDNNYWSDFGGSTNNDESVFQTAIREGYEELEGFMGNKNQLEKKVSQNLIKMCFTERYTTFLFYVDCNELINLQNNFNNNKKFINENKIYELIEDILEQKNGLLEKSQLKLFNKKELLVGISDIRPFYRNIVYELLELEKNEIN